ncbi:ATP-binding protein (plasmid) [Streptomyces viridifaciens]|nr:ATP-binding protein [Streptomyces viridifaciens]
MPVKAQLTPHEARLSFAIPAELVQIGALRRWAQAALAESGLHLDDPLVGDVQLVIAELGANAVLHGCGGERPDVELTACLQHSGGVLRMSVTDPGHAKPVQGRADTEATSGRGLQLVRHVADRCGVDDLGVVGKSVWAELDLPEAVVVQAPAAAVTGEAVEPQTAVLRAVSSVRVLRPQPAVGTIPVRPTLRQRPIPAA